MAGHDAWWLKKNALIPTDAQVDSVDVVRERGVLSSIDQVIPSPRQDQAKQEVFGGGRRIRRNSEEIVVPAPYGVVITGREGRRHSSDELRVDNPNLLQMPSWNGVPRVPPAPETEWRLGDSKPFTLDGHLKILPVRVEPATEWRTGSDEPLSLLDSGASPMKRRPPNPTLNSEWRKFHPQMSDEMIPDLNMSPSSKQRILASRLPASTYTPRVMDTSWRTGSKEPLQIVYDRQVNSEYTPGSPRRMSVGTDTTWRTGDLQPFRMDGSAAGRSVPSGIKAASHWRKGDSEPLDFSTHERPRDMQNQQDSPRVSFADSPRSRVRRPSLDDPERMPIRERQLINDREALMEMMAEVNKPKDSDVHASQGRSVARLRRGENSFGPAMSPR